MGKSNKLVLIDGNSIAYRAFFALPLLNNDKGVYTNAVYGFTQMLLKILEDEKPTHMLVAFDAGKTTFRHKTFGEYKGGRQKTPPELSEQFPFIRQLLDAFQIKRYELENYEADDIIGTLASHAADGDWDVKVFTGDKDLLQLVTPDVEVVLTRKGITEVEAYTVEQVNERYGITPDQIIDMKGLMGDPSDNIPGVPGVGEKTAIKLIKQFGSIEKVLDSIDGISGAKLKERLTENKDQALMSKELATITKEAPVEISLDETNYKGFENSLVFPLFKELGFNSLLERLGGDEEIPQETEKEELTYKNATSIEPDMLKSPSSLVVETLTEDYHKAKIHGFALSNESGTFYISSNLAEKSEDFKAWLEDENQKKKMFDAKRAHVALHGQGITLNGIEFDVQLASYLLNPSESLDDVADVAKQYGKLNVDANEAVYGKGAKKKLPEEDVLAEHLSRKAHTIFRLSDILAEKLKENEQSDLFYHLEMPLALVLAKMEEYGVKVKADTLQKMGTDLELQVTSLEKEIHDLAGVAFNINSPKQLGEILFEKLNLPAIKKTKTGYSTSVDVLEKLEGKHEIINKILIYRQLGKLKSTYIEGLLKVVKEDTGRIHTRFNQVLAQTGRLSSIDPNLQNIPIRLEAGRKIRHAFVASKPGWKILAADYSQIELRVLAHISQDENLIEAFKTEMDVHTKTAMDVFHVEEGEVTSEMRRHAKAVNFGIVYGISDYGLSQSLGITRKEAGEFIKSYLESFPGVQQYMKDSITDAKQNGYVSTLLHRRRYLPEINSRNFNLRSFAERTAMNTPIQGTAADIIKKAMVDMDQRLSEEKLEAKMLLTVHDELIFEVPEEELQKLEQIVCEVMEQAVELDVPLKVDVNWGDSWFEAK
ncbi:DNA polymerase I [Fictibacillus barbaricus]|uniref:DNA polymerase I n=1 Tax=Fictibacillus barbaricus TaxID=182136 RepID=A0ABS2ZL83_9BACL|nr:DNA polymerase I [Fictibacillus barbaricus]MBN3547369.1 DNA polymerase I [Fictibacillus barbaricus]GGB48500.1 DNA polymerase I [Fictibacillus barbaricus]